MKSYDEINEKIKSGKALVLTADEIIDYVDERGLERAAEEVDVVTTATFGPMCSSGCFINLGHSSPKMRISQATLDSVGVYGGIAAVDLFLGATELRIQDPANMNYPGDFSFGGGHVMEKLVAGEAIHLQARSYGTDDYPLKQLETYFTMDDLNQCIMVNPRNAYQNYNVATNISEKTIYTYLGVLKPRMKNLGYSSAGQLSPLLNDPLYRTIGVGTPIWLAGSKGHVFSQGTQFTSKCERGEKDVPKEGSGTLGVTADMKQMDSRYLRGLSLKGYGVSLSVGLGIPIPILDKEMLWQTTVRDREIEAMVIDYSHDYPEKTGNVLATVNYEELKSGTVTIQGKEVQCGSLSSYAMAQEIAAKLKSEIQSGDFLLNPPISTFPLDQSMKGLTIRGKEQL